MHACLRCHRHVRETVCPFCQAEAPVPVRATGGAMPRAGLTRGALLAGALTVTGCGTTVAAYGIPPDAMATEAGSDAVAPAYGIPVDAPAPDAVMPDTAPAPAYGIPPGRDQ
jgi:hypothetical protein